MGLVGGGSIRGRAQSTATATPTSPDNSTGSGAGAGGDLSSEAIGDAIVSGLSSLLETLFSPIRGLIQSQANGLLDLLVGTPHPDMIFARPNTSPWLALYQYYWDAIIPLTLLLFGLSLIVIVLLESMSHLLSGYHRAHLKRRAFVGLMGILSWWWIAGFSLQLADELTRFLMPSLDSISLFQTLSFAGIGLLGVVATLSVDLLLFVLIALIYFVRQLVLYAFVLGMPLLIVAWIPGVGPFGFSAHFAQRLAGFYVPFLLMTVPVALLFRLGELLGESATLSLGGIGLWLTALVIPFVAVLSPFVLVWQAGSILPVADKLARHASRERLQQRTGYARQRMGDATHAGRNTMRGLRDEPAVRHDGQTLLQSNSGAATSRGHRVGSGLRSGSTLLRETFRFGSDDGWSEPGRDAGRYEPREYNNEWGTDTNSGYTRSRSSESWGRDP